MVARLAAGNITDLVKSLPRENFGAKKRERLLFKQIKKTDLSDGIWNATAIQLGRIQVEFGALFGSKEMKRRLTTKERTSELLRICHREELSYTCFEFLERRLITEKETL
jgi:hypothetical protein